MVELLGFVLLGVAGWMIFQERAQARIPASETPAPPSPPVPNPPTAANEISGDEIRAAILGFGQSYRIPYEILAGVARVESNFAVNAKGSAGELGMFQFMQTTAETIQKRLGIEVRHENVIDPRIGARLAAYLLDENWRLIDGHSPGLLTDRDDISQWREPLKAYNVGFRRWVKGGGLNSYADKVFAWIETNRADRVALVPIDKVSIA